MKLNASKKKEKVEITREFCHGKSTINIILTERGKYFTKTSYLVTKAKFFKKQHSM